MHIELVSYSATQPNTGGAGAALTGDSLTIKNFQQGGARILAWWGFNQVEGWHQLVFPSGHDTTRNLREVVDVLNPELIWPAINVPIELQAQELMSLTIAGSNVSGDVEIGCFLVQYDNLPNVESGLIDYAELLRRAQPSKSLTIQATITGSGAGYSGAELVTAESDLLHANTDYAVVGIGSDTPCAAVTLVGPDTGYVKVGVPGDVAHRDVAGGFFVGLARAYGAKTIPVINSGNKASTYLGVAMNENAGATIVSVNLIELKRK